MPANRRPGWRIHAIVIASYTLLAIGLTWPLAANLTTHVPGVPQWAFDESTFVWNIWYFKHALIDNLRSPLHSELIWFPLGIDLILYTYNFFHVLAALPLALAANLPFASNLALLASTVLSGYGTWLLVVYLLGEEGRVASGEWRVAGGGWRGARGEGRGARRAQVAAFAAGALFAFASNRAVYSALGHYDMVTTQWIPFYALALLRTLDGRLSVTARRRAAVLAGLFFAFTGLAEMISALFLAMFTGIVLIGRVASGEGRGARGNSQFTIHNSQFTSASPPVATRPSPLLLFLLLGVVAFLTWSPVLIPILREFFTASYDLQGWGDALALSTDLLGWLTPTVLHPIFGGDLVNELHQVQLRAINPSLPGFRDVNTVFLGWVSLAVAVIGAVVYRRKVAIWIWTSILFGVFTLGPLLQIDGRSRFDLDGLETTFPLPFMLLHYLPVIKANRAPNRNSVLLMLGLAVLAGYGVYWLMKRLGDWETKRFGRNPQSPNRLVPQSLLAILIVGLILFEHLAVPFPLSDARIPAVYEQIAADPDPGSVLQIPLGWRNSFGVFGPEQTLLQYYQSAHGKPILGGNISRAPDFKLDYFERIAYFQALSEIEFGREVAPETLEAARAQAAGLVYLYNTAYVILTPPIPDRLPYADTWRATWDFVKSSLPLETDPFWAQDGIEAYRVVQPAGSDAFRLDLGTAGTYPYRGEGWDAAEVDESHGAAAIWAVDEASRLFIPLRGVDAPATYTVRLQVHPFVYPGGPAQTVTLIVNGAAQEQRTLADGWQTVEWQVPGALLVNGLNHLDLAWAYAAAPRAVMGGDRLIGSTGVQLPIDADVKAFADGGFMALFDEAGTQIDGSAGRRGVNVTVLEPQTGRVEAQLGFDTTANAGESAKLAEFVAGIEPGRPVLVASYADAWSHLTEEAAAALRSLGAGVTLEDLNEKYFAIAGVKGAQPGTAAQSIDPVEAFLRVSLNRDRRQLAGAVDWLEVAPATQP